MRAALLTVVLLVHGLLAAPFPHEITRKGLDSPEGQQEIAAWMEVVRGIGLPLPQARVEALLMDTTGRLDRFHEAARAPFRPLLRLTGTGQAWALFVNPDTHPHRLRIQGRVGTGPWRTLYLRNDVERNLLARKLSFRRLWGIYDDNTRDRPFVHPTELGRAGERVRAHFYSSSPKSIDSDLTGT